jgi:GrpB-like predicted nucleotidyltransferase (UPF0157 family)/catechol 2,3-dioxygenase-like lactoylglutathione lyase family enzyme
MKITLSPFNPEWKKIFEKEKVKLEAVLKDNAVAIEHIGSTSVEGLGAKPVIDILIGIDDFNNANKTVPAMKEDGFDYIDKYEDTMPGRRFFIRTENENKFHIHLVEFNGSFWRRHILFRNYLREFDDVRDEYFNLKRTLSEKEWDDSNDYAFAKTEFIRRMEKEAESYFSKKEKTGLLHHVEIYVSDLQRSKKFWQWLLNKFGYQVIHEWDKGISLMLKDTYIVLVQTEEKYKDISYHRCRTGLNHLAFHAPSEKFIDDLTHELREQKINILYEDKHPHAGGSYGVFFEDPDRIKLEVTM